jgi:pimeloyl-ACP methyl ester carboxylesterase
MVRRSGIPRKRSMRCTGAYRPRLAGRSLSACVRPSRRRAQYPLRGHPDLPTVLIYATDDEIFEPAWERFMARQLLGIEPIEIAGGHFPMVEGPRGLAPV